MKILQGQHRITVNKGRKHRVGSEISVTNRFLCNRTEHCSVLDLVLIKDIREHWRSSKFKVDISMRFDIRNKIVREEGKGKVLQTTFVFIGA